MPESNPSWNRTLFIVPPRVKSICRVVAGVLLILVYGLSLFMVWRESKDYALIQPATGIPGWLVLVEIHLLALLGVRSCYKLIRNRFRFPLMGIEFAALSFLDNPRRLRSVKASDYAEVFPLFFGFSTIMLLFLAGVAVWEWKLDRQELQASPGQEASEGEA